MSKERARSFGRHLVVGTVALALTLSLLAGFSPREAAAYKSTSLACTTLESGFLYADAQAQRARMNGDSKGVDYWSKIGMSLQSVYLSLNCSYSFYEGPAV